MNNQNIRKYRNIQNLNSFYIPNIKIEQINKKKCIACKL